MSMQSLPAWLARTGQTWTLAVHVQPGARRTQVQGEHGGALKLRLAAPPVDGKANEELLAFVAGRLAVPRRAVVLASGASSRHKRVRIEADLAADALVSALWDDERLGPLG